MVEWMDEVNLINLLSGLKETSKLYQNVKEVCDIFKSTCARMIIGVNQPIIKMFKIQHLT